MTDFSDLPLENGDAKLEKFDRDLECEHRDTLDDGSLEPCHIEAEWAITTADFGDPSRVRYCSHHIWNGVENWMGRNEGGANE
jgi:hypothetical protein